MIPKFPEFKQLELSDRTILTDKLKAMSPNICELALANLYIWMDFDRPQLTLLNDNICVLINPLNETPYFLEPIGRNKPIETIETCLQYTKYLSRVSEDFISLIPVDPYKTTCQRSQFDYIYKIDELAALAGKKYDGKRNHINKFKKHFPNYRYEQISLGIKDKALELFEKWFKAREESRYFPRLAHSAQRNALEKAFLYFNELNLLGGAIFSENELLGFIIGSELNKETISAHFQYVDPTFQGVAQAILNEACRKTFNGYKFVNLEQDLGIPGLRKAKLSYHPFKIEKKFKLELKP
ncbi:DUF2156 domain-containing protein [Candidatus Saganbacteria bacterium]|nr:DUF2156 domain-containing protein [Candidatus Saganbacteria bacterium]